MFRLIEDTLEPDPSFAADFQKLGFFVNNVGHIRMIEAPDKPYIFHATNNERVNEVRREAMQACQREETEKRLSALGLTRLYLPEFATAKPHRPHVPILAPPPENLKTRKRVVVLINDALQDLGILAYRQLQRELGVNGGSVVNFVKELIKRSTAGDAAVEYKDIFEDGHGVKNDSDTPALVVLNTGQLLYSHKYNQSMTMRSWSALPRKSGAHDMIRIHEEENRVKGHRNPKEHIKSVFDDVLCNPERVAPDAEVYVIAIENGTENILNLLSEDFEKYGSRISGMALVHSLIDDSQIKNSSLRTFLHQRTRQWKYSDLTFDPRHCTDLPDNYDEGLSNHLPQDTLLTAKSAQHISWSEELPRPGALSGITKALHRLALGITPSTTSSNDTSMEWSTGLAVICPTFAGGDNPVGECVFTNPVVQREILSFFEEVAQDPENYRNPDIRIFTQAPQPTPEDPLMLSAYDPADIDFQSLQPAMTPEQADLDEARQTLIDMRIALDACPMNVPELEKGRERLVKKVQNKEVEIEDLAQKAFAGGDLSWKPQKEGPMVQFAGTMVDSELLKAAGLLDTAASELEQLGGGGDEEKAFL